MGDVVNIMLAAKNSRELFLIQKLLIVDLRVEINLTIFLHLFLKRKKNAAKQILTGKVWAKEVSS